MRLAILIINENLTSTSFQRAFFMNSIFGEHLVDATGHKHLFHYKNVDKLYEQRFTAPWDFVWNSLATAEEGSSVKASASKQWVVDLWEEFLEEWEQGEAEVDEDEVWAEGDMEWNEWDSEAHSLFVPETAPTEQHYALPLAQTDASFEAKGSSRRGYIDSNKALLRDAHPEAQYSDAMDIDNAVPESTETRNSSTPFTSAFLTNLGPPHRPLKSNAKTMVWEDVHRHVLETLYERFPSTRTAHRLRAFNYIFRNYLLACGVEDGELKANAFSAQWVERKREGPGWVGLWAPEGKPQPRYSEEMQRELALLVRDVEFAVEVTKSGESFGG